MPSSGIGRVMRQASAAIAALAVAIFSAPAAHAAGGLIRDAEIEDTLRAYGNPIFEAAGLRSNDIQIHIVEDKSLNAFVTSGQHMFIHTGLILAADTPNQLKGVMAHETGHIAGGHLVRSREAAGKATVPAMISMGLGVLLMAAGAPDAGMTVMSGAGQMATANFFIHTKVQESSADQAAVTYLDKTGQSPEGLLGFFNEFREQELYSQDRRQPYFRSHPLSSDRIEALRARIEHSEHKDAVDSPEDLLRFKMMQAKLYGYLESPSRTYAKYPDSDKSQPARYARAFAAYRTPDLKRAVSETQALIDIDPKNPYYQELMGQILFESGRAAEAVPFNRRALALSNNNVLLQINLGRSLTATKKPADIKEAISILENATSREKDNPFGWSELATAYYANKQEGMAGLASAEKNFALGNYPMALNFAQRAKKELPEGSTSWRRASDIALVAEAESREMRKKS
jgi:predicted Zn-dependent protease